MRVTPGRTSQIYEESKNKFCKLIPLLLRTEMRDWVHTKYDKREILFYLMIKTIWYGKSGHRNTNETWKFKWNWRKG